MAQKNEWTLVHVSDSFMRMTTPNATPANGKKVAQIEAALRAILAEALRRGFFGTAAIELSIQDGTIQHIRRTVDRIEK